MANPLRFFTMQNRFIPGFLTPSAQDAITVFIWIQFHFQIVWMLPPKQTTA